MLPAKCPRWTFICTGTRVQHHFPIVPSAGRGLSSLWSFFTAASTSPRYPCLLLCRLCLNFLIDPFYPVTDFIQLPTMLCIGGAIQMREIGSGSHASFPKARTETGQVTEGFLGGSDSSFGTSRPKGMLCFCLTGSLQVLRCELEAVGGQEPRGM